jgi:hypothetical protein
MSGDPTKANLWTDADVYVSTNLSAALPADADTPFGVDWDLVGFETREGEKVRRLITALYGEVSLDGDHGENETDLESATLACTIFPTSDGDLFHRQRTPVLDSISVAPATLSVADGEIGALTATATYSDSSTGNVTSAATWSSSDPTKATVSAGFVTGIAAGTATVTATYGGQTDTCAVTVTA